MIADALTRAVYPVIIDAVERAILPRFQTLQDGEIIDKGGNELVTVADREAEVILAEGLARIIPDAAIVGEEAASADPSLLDKLGSDRCWIIDPVDGTNNFAAGKGPFGVLVALSEGGETVAGWIYDPLTRRFCHAIKGGGAFMMGEPLKAKPSSQEPPIAAISLVFMDQAKREAMRRHIAPHYQLVDIPRCAAEQYPRIAFGINDVSIFERTLAWDHAAGVLFLNEAGGKAARPDGRPYRVDEAHLPGLIGAASPALWDQLAERLDLL